LGHPEEDGGRGVRGSGCEGVEAGVAHYLRHGRDVVGRVGAGDEVGRADGVGDAECGVHRVGRELSAGRPVLRSRG